MTMDELKEERNKYRIERALKQTELEIATAQLQLLNRRIQEICPHKHKSGVIIKYCPDCGKADYFWSF